MTATQTVPVVSDLEVLDPYECCECGDLATCTATVLSCGHSAPYCTRCRKMRQRAAIIRDRLRLPTPCSWQGCGTVIEAIAWNRR